MSYSSQTSSGVNFCEDFHLSLLMQGGEFNNPTFNIIEPVGTLQALMSEWNFTNVMGNLDRSSLTPFKVPNLPRGSSSIVSSAITCDPGDTIDYSEQRIDPRLFFQKQVSFNVTDEQLRLYCESYRQIISMVDSEFYVQDAQYRRNAMRDPMFLGRVSMAGAESNVRGIPHYTDIYNKLMSQMHALRVAINETVVAKILALTGINAATGSSAPITLAFLQANNSKHEEGYQIINKQFQYDNELNGRWMVIGGGIFDQFNTSMQYGCCNSGGTNFGQMRDDSPYLYFRDKAVPRLSGDVDQIMVLAQNAVQFMHYNSWMAIDSPSRMQMNTQWGIAPDPLVPGLVYDLRIKPEECVNNDPMPNYSVWLSLNFDTLLIPDFAFSPGDPLYRMNGIFQYIAAQV